jgi:predicted nucleic acid-binding protein
VIPVNPSAFLDANILFSGTLRDWICLLSLHSGAFDVKWSEDVLAEYMYHWRRKNPDAGDHALGGIRRRLTTAFPDAVVAGYHPGSVPELPDPHDRHVLAAALHGKADILVTDDKEDFPADVVADRLDVYSVDEFLCRVADRHPATVPLVLDAQLRHFAKNAIVRGHRTRHDLIDALARAGAKEFAERLSSLNAD